MEYAKEFVKACGREVPDTPRALPPDRIKFICKMVLEECKELLATEFDQGDIVLQEILQETKSVNKVEFQNDKEKMMEQADAFVDIQYYLNDTAAQHGWPLQAMMDRVHQANMAKRDPKTQVFLRREDGKILKPPGWKPPVFEDLF